MKDHAHNIFLVGPMGAGKSTIGRQLARSLNFVFVDSDKEIEARTGVNIPVIFDIEGETGFRAREAQVLTELTARSGIVLATGGGAVLHSENRVHLCTRGCVVYLFAALELLADRTSRDRNRPLLNGGDPRTKLSALMQTREPLYREVADLIVDTSRRTVRQVVQEIRQQLPQFT